MARCDSCVKSFEVGDGRCPLGRTLFTVRNAEGEHGCLSFKGKEVIAAARKRRERQGRAEMAVAQEGLF